MRRSLPRLAYMITQMDTSPDTTIGDIALNLEETSERIMDALDLLKVMRGEYQEIPDIPWEFPYNT